MNPFAAIGDLVLAGPRAARRAGRKAMTMRWGSPSTWLVWSATTDRDIARLAGDGSNNSAVAACLHWVMTTFPEARLRVRKPNNEGGLDDVRGHDLLRLVGRPNDWYPGEILWQATMLSYTLDGNAYWRKMRDDAGLVRELWWIPHNQIKPAFPSGTTDTFISHYEYRPGGTTISLPVEDVVHFRFGLDPSNPRKGMSRLAAVMREIFTDDEAARFTAALLMNFGVPGVIISPDGDGTVTPEEAESIKTSYMEKFGRGKRGEPMVAFSKTKIQQFGFSPEQMNLDSIRHIPEERVTAALNIPAAVVGLGVGLEQTKVGATLRELRELAYEGNIVPTQRVTGAVLGSQLLPDVDTDAENMVVDFDNSEVRVLQEDENQLHERIQGDVAGGFLMVVDAQRILGLPEDETQRVYLRNMAMLEVSTGETGQTIETEAAARKDGEAYGFGITKVSEADRRYVAMQRRALGQIQKVLAAELARIFAAMGEAAAEAYGELAAEGAVAASRNGDSKDAGDADVVNIILRRMEFEALFVGDLFESYRRAYQLAGEATFEATGARLGIEMAWDIAEPYAQRLLQEGGLRLGLADIEAQTRQALFDALSEGRELGEGVDAIKRRIREHVPVGRYRRMAARFGQRRAINYRSQLIARTEAKTAQNLSSVDAFRESGVVPEVVVLDGEDCGWASHDDPDLADGSIRTLDEAQANPLAHPQCVRSFAPAPVGTESQPRLLSREHVGAD